MTDVVIIGGGHAGVMLGDACLESGLSVIIVDDSSEQPLSREGQWLKGRGVVSSAGLVAVLDPATGDEKQLIQTYAIVFTVGKLEAAKPVNVMLGITKAGAVLSPDGQTIVTDHKGRTRASGIYASGSCASCATPDIVKDLVARCGASLLS